MSEKILHETPWLRADAKVLSVRTINGLQYILHTRGGGLADDGTIELDAIDATTGGLHLILQTPYVSWILILQEEVDTLRERVDELQRQLGNAVTALGENRELRAADAQVFDAKMRAKERELAEAREAIGSLLDAGDSMRFSVVVPAHSRSKWDEVRNLPAVRAALEGK